MSRRNKLLAAPPYPVEQSIERLGENLRIARLRRNISLEEVARKIGTNRRVVADAERGKPSTGIAIYVALLWAYGLIEQLSEVADPLNDEEGLILASDRDRIRARTREPLDNDF